MMRVPIIPTIIVLAAVATMIALGIWQLGRADEKEALLERYTRASGSSLAPWPKTEAEEKQYLYRRAILDCIRVTARRTAAGTSASGAKGLAQIAACRLADGTEADIVLGFTRRPDEGNWAGGEVLGIIAPGPRLVAVKPPVPALAPVAPPDPRDLPNNHLAYAGQWFFFALTALVIYVLALRRKWRASGE